MSLRLIIKKNDNIVTEDSISKLSLIEVKPRERARNDSTQASLNPPLLSDLLQLRFLLLTEHLDEANTALKRLR